LRYEPWILGQEPAKRAGETLCSGKKSVAPWSPDIVIEFLRQIGDAWQPIYVLVMDCKYSKKIDEQRWGRVDKYSNIRSTVGLSQVVRQLWIIAPAQAPKIVSDDENVEFTELGPDCSPLEQVKFELMVSPEGLQSSSAPSGCLDDHFLKVARGTLGFVQTHMDALTGAS